MWARPRGAVVGSTFPCNVNRCHNLFASERKIGLTGRKHESLLAFPGFFLPENHPVEWQVRCYAVPQRFSRQFPRQRLGPTSAHGQPGSRKWLRDPTLISGLRGDLWNCDSSRLCEWNDRTYDQTLKMARPSTGPPKKRNHWPFLPPLYGCCVNIIRCTLSDFDDFWLPQGLGAVFE